MGKRTLLAVGLSIVVMIVFFAIQAALYPPPEQVLPPAGQTLSQVPAQSSPAQDGQTLPAQTESPAQTQTLGVPVPAGENVPPREITIKTNLIEVKLTNAGGDIVSYKLLEHMDGEEPVEMIFAPQNPNPHAFGITFGSRDHLLAGGTKLLEDNFVVTPVSDRIVEFSRDYDIPSGGSFKLTKRYEFADEYLFKLTISMSATDSLSSYNFQNAAYTMTFGPQIGPKFEQLDPRYEYRNYLTYSGELNTERVADRGTTVLNTQPIWTALAGKYFTFIVRPDHGQNEIAFSTIPETGSPIVSRLYITRPAVNTSTVNDIYYFYLGPKNVDTLNSYENGNNSFRLSGTGFTEVADTKGFLAPLENLLKWLLSIFHMIPPNNYGVAILLLTIFVKILLFPLTKKGSQSTLRMQALSPKIKEIKEKYGDNPQKMNAEMAKLYKEEGYNPLSGCLPMLIQLPIFFAMYNLFSNHFDLRGAEFIPGWIPDLSRPESIYDFKDGFTLPILGWTAIRALPFIYVASQLLYGKVTQTPDQKGTTQMKLMLFVMPIVFFFILYNVPSGLLIYWIMSNVLTLVQQKSINRFLARKKAASGGDEPKPVIAPGGSKKKRK